MIAADEDALVCDLAETYHVLDYRSLPVRLLATLAQGLRPDSRVRMAMTGSPAPTAEILLAGIVDRLGQLVWMQSADGVKGRNRPASVLDTLLGKTTREGNDTVVTFDTATEYEAAMAAAKRGGDADGH